MDWRDFDRRIYARMEREGSFAKASLPSGNLISRTFDRAYDPVVGHVGKASITSPFITAVKRKNPLALLNPVFFEMSW